MIEFNIFDELCTRCSKCIIACPTFALEDWFGEIQYSPNICEPDYCRACEDIFPTHAIKLTLVPNTSEINEVESKNKII